MPFLSGALSIRRYITLGEPSPALSQTGTLAIRRYAFRPIDDSRGEKEAVGWINPRDVLAKQFTWDDLKESCYLFLGFRQDTKKLCPVLYKARLHRRMDEVKAERNLQKITRQQRLALEEELTMQMLKEVTPTHHFAQMLWDMNSGIVLFSGASSSAMDRLQETFEATFDLKIRPTFPSLLAAEFIAANGLEEEYHLASAAAERNCA